VGEGAPASHDDDVVLVVGDRWSFGPFLDSGSARCAPI
jgi:hypothetical protein